jgi:hypothetical protein
MPRGVGAASQRLIPTGERSGLQTPHRDDGKRFVVRAEDLLTAFLELEVAIPAPERLGNLIIFVSGPAARQSH